MKGILLYVFILLGTSVFAQEYSFHNFNSENGLAQSYVYSITQDQLGYLWVGTGNGLSKFNGLKFENFIFNDSLDDNFITSGICDGKNTCFGHMNGGLTFFNGKKIQYIPASTPTPSPVTHFTLDPAGKIWVSNYSDGLRELSKEMTVHKQYKFKDPISIISFEFINDKKILVGSSNGLLYCSLNQSGLLQVIRTIKEVGESKVSSVIKMRNHKGYYVATENDGIYKILMRDGNIETEKIIVNSDSIFVAVQNIFEDSQSNLWLSSFGNGITKLTSTGSGLFSHRTIINKFTRFISDNVKTITEDREGNIWSGNYGEGLTMLTPKIFSILSFENSEYGSSINSIFIDKHFKWVGTENGLIKMSLLDDKIIAFYGLHKNLPSDAVTAIYSNGENTVWIGTEKNGLFLLDISSEKIIKYPIASGTLENSITNIARNEGLVWVGTKKGLCSINPASKQINWFTINQGGLPHNYINSLFTDRKKKLWVSTHSNVLAYIENNVVHKLALNSGNGILTLGPITEDSQSRLWVGSFGNGVYLINSDSVINFTVKEGLVSNYCYSIICDSSQNIWVTHKGGLSRIRISDFSVKPVQHIEGSADYIQFNSNAISIDQPGKIWFGSDKGLISYDKSMENSNPKAPLLVITSIKINDEEKKLTDKITLSPGSYKIKIDFLGIILKEPALVTYQYKLEGYDQWSEIVKSTTVTFNHVTDGNYTFILKASSGDGTVCETPLIINITINKPLWKKWWVYLISVSIIIILVYFYIKRREYEFQSEKSILEEKVAQRTYEIQCKKNEIELQAELLNEKNASITSSIRYARHIQNAVLPPTDLIGKLLPDNFILSLPKDIVSGDFYWLAQKNNKIVFTVADCTGHGVPGAFMSLLGITLLNEIVNIQGILDSGEIVNELRRRVILSLQQGRKDIPTTDGMDISLCVLDKQHRKIQYTGGMNDIVLISDGKIKIIKADRFSVCSLYADITTFKMKEVEHNKGDLLYLFSDGFQDQFGGARDKKFLTKKFYATLLEIHSLPMADQRDILEKRINDWMKDTIQTDDITVMGIRL